MRHAGNVAGKAVASGPILACRETRRNNGGARQTVQTKSPVRETRLKISVVRPCGVAMEGETPSIMGEFTGETHRVLEHIQTHPPGNQHQKGPICL